MFSEEMIKIKNAQVVGKSRVVLEHSRLISNVLKVLKAHKFIEDFDVRGGIIKKKIVVYLKKEEPTIKDIRFISKPSRAIYAKSFETHPPKDGRGIQVISTPKGVMDNWQATKENVGGKVLFELYI